MRVAPTLDKSLRIDAENATDWLILEMICTDASQHPSGSLAHKFGNHMCADDDWEELITPELQDQFNQQITHISRAISSAEKADDLSGSVFISAEHADTWFGALNQARLSLEEQYNLSQYEEVEDIDPSMPHCRAAMIRSHFYGSLQSLLLEFILS